MSTTLLQINIYGSYKINNPINLYKYCKIKQLPCNYFTCQKLNLLSIYN